MDLLGSAKQRTIELLSRVPALTTADRDELESIIDQIGPPAAAWLPDAIPSRETMAIALARLWLIAPDRKAILHATSPHLRTATDVLRIACVLMDANPELAQPMRLSSLSRGLRRTVLAALERLPLEEVVEQMQAHRTLWKRVGEQLHPFELAAALPSAALAFAVIRGTRLGNVTFGDQLRERAVQLRFLYIEDDVIKAIAWAAPIEDALRAGNPRSALARLTHRPIELLRRADHLIRVAQKRQIDALSTILKAIELSAAKGPAAAMLTVSAHIARRSRPWPRRVFFARGDVLRAWGTPDKRPALRGDAIAIVVGAVRRQLCSRAEANRQFPRAVIDRALVDVVMPSDGSTARGSRDDISWPRGSEVALPSGLEIRVLLHWAQAPPQSCTLSLGVSLFDAQWRHVETRDGSLVDTGTSVVDLHLEQLTMLGVRHAVVTVFSGGSVRLEELAHAFVGVTRPPDGDAFDPKSVPQRFDLRGRPFLAIPLSIDVSERRLRWLDVRLADKKLVQAAGGYRAALAHIGRDYADLIGTHTRPTMWDVACVHAAARANVVYIRERDGTFTMYRRRDKESKLARLGRLMSGATDDGRLGVFPPASAPTWFALVSPMSLPKGSVGYALDGRGMSADVHRMSATELVAELRPSGAFAPKLSRSD